MIRSKNGKLIVEVYDPTTQKKVYVKPGDHGMTAPRSMRDARTLERLALSAVEARARRQPAGEETVGSFLLDPWSQDSASGRGRWTRDYANKRGESTIVHNSERVRRFAEQHRDRTLRSITRAEARRQAANHEGTIRALRAAWSDAKRDGLVDENVFAGLGIERRRGREEIVPLLMEEVHRLAEIATELNGTSPFGQEVSAAILWAAYTMCRPGETFAARRSLLDGDTYHLSTQMNSTLGRETAPKHGGHGTIYLPDPAVQVIERLPPRLHDDLLFHTKTGRQFRQESWWRTWDPIRTQLARELPAGHHLRQRLAQDPDDKLDFHELRHMGASYALNVLEIEPWSSPNNSATPTTAPSSSSSTATPPDRPPWTACGVGGVRTCGSCRSSARRPIGLSTSRCSQPGELSSGRRHCDPLRVRCPSRRAAVLLPLDRDRGCVRDASSYGGPCQPRSPRRRQGPSL